MPNNEEISFRISTTEIAKLQCLTVKMGISEGAVCNPHWIVIANMDANNALLRRSEDMSSMN